MPFRSLASSLQKLRLVLRNEPGTQVARVFPVVVLGFYGLDVIVAGGLQLDLLAMRVFWAVCLAFYPWALRTLPKGQARLLAVFHGVLAGGIGVALPILTGGVSSPYIASIPGWQLIVLLLYQRGIIELLSSGVVGSVGAFMIMKMAGRPTTDALVWATLPASSCFLGLYCSSWLYKMQAAEHQVSLERARREALEALAVSESRRTQSEKLALIGKLAAGVMHEINNPLSYVRSNLDFLQRELLAETPSSREELTEVLAETRAGVEHIQRIAGDLKGFSSMGAEESSPCVLADVVGDAVKLASLRLKYVAHLTMEVPKDLPEVFVVRRKLAQVVLNLLVNAGDALDEHRVQAGEVRVTGQLVEGRVVLHVEDNGPGFPQELLPRLFETFITTKSPEKGTGLGLMLSRELVEQFGGVLTVANKPEGGARLSITFPTRENAPRTTSHPSMPAVA